MDGLLEELGELVAPSKFQQLAIVVAQFVRGVEDLVEEAVFLVLAQGPRLLRGQPDGDRHLAGVARGWDDELRALAGGECQRNQGVGSGDALHGVALVHDCRAELAGTLEGQAGNVDAIQPVPPLQVHPARTSSEERRGGNERVSTGRYGWPRIQ